MTEDLKKAWGPPKGSVEHFDNKLRSYTVPESNKHATHLHETFLGPQEQQAYLSNPHIVEYHKNMENAPKIPPGGIYYPSAEGDLFNAKKREFHKTQHGHLVQASKLLGETQPGTANHTVSNFISALMNKHGKASIPPPRGPLARSEYLEKKAPPGFSEETMHKLKQEHGVESAFKIAWAAHNKKTKETEKAMTPEEETKWAHDFKVSADTGKPMNLPKPAAPVPTMTEEQETQWGQSLKMPHRKLIKMKKEITKEVSKEVKKADVGQANKEIQSFTSLATHPTAKPAPGMGAKPSKPAAVKLPHQKFGVGSVVQGMGAKPGPNLHPTNPGPKLPKPPGPGGQG